MEWYRVTKTINKHKYEYWQKTYRADGGVKTLNRYIGKLKPDGVEIDDGTISNGPNNPGGNYGRSTREANSS